MIFKILNCFTIIFMCYSTSVFADEKQYDPIILENKTWYGISGFSEDYIKGMTLDDKNAIVINSFPINIQKVFNLPADGKTYHVSLCTKFDSTNIVDNSSNIISLYLPSIGENWEIFLNGKLLQREIFTDGSRITKQRYLVKSSIMFDKSLLMDKENYLLIHLIGRTSPIPYSSNIDFGLMNEWGYRITGLDDALFSFMSIILFYINGITFVFGIVFLIFYLMNKANLYNLYYAVFTFLLSARFFFRTRAAYGLFSNSAIIIKAEYISTFLLLPIFLFFISSYFYNKKNTKIFYSISVFCFLFSFLTLVFPINWASSFLLIWQICMLPMLIYMIHYIVSFMRTSKSDVKSISFYLIIVFFGGVWDFFDSMFFKTEVALLEICFFALLSRIAFLSFQRYSNMHKETEKLNETLSKQKDAFYKFVPMNFLKLLDKDSAIDLKLGESNLLKMSVLFSDIRSFTSISEKLSPAENFAFLNEFLLRMEPAISSNKGFVDKYLGDGILALFSDDNSGIISSSDYAIHSAIEMHKELKVYNDLRISNSLTPIKIGIGINTGELMLGTVGSSTRIDTTVIGNTVNLSSRLENLTSFYNCGIIASAASIMGLSAHNSFHFREIDTVQVKGKTEPIVIYEIYDFEDDDSIAKKDENKGFIGSGIINYKLKNFKEAYKDFKQAYRIFPEDKVARVYLIRCKKFLASPPPDNWEGIIVFDKKVGV